MSIYYELDIMMDCIRYDSIIIWLSIDIYLYICCEVHKYFITFLTQFKSYIIQSYTILGIPIYSISHTTLILNIIIQIYYDVRDVAVLVFTKV